MKQSLYSFLKNYSLPQNRQKQGSQNYLLLFIVQLERKPQVSDMVGTTRAFRSKTSKKKKKMARERWVWEKESMLAESVGIQRCEIRSLMSNKIEGPKLDYAQDAHD